MPRVRRGTLTPKAPYGAATLDKGLDVLEAVQRAPAPLSIQEIAQATRIQRLAVYRLLCTLERRGYVERLADKKFRAQVRGRRILLGYCAPLTGNSFRCDLTASIQRAAAASGMELIALDNPDDDCDAGVASARQLIDAKVDAAVIFQPVEWIGHAVADRFFHAGIPFVSIEVPLQGGVYFGANNYRAGRMAGEFLGRVAMERWGGKFDRLLLVESSLVGSNGQARLGGVLVGLRGIVGEVKESQVIHADGRAHVESSRDVVAGVLRHLPRNARVLISGFNDLSSLGALQAVRAAGREKNSIIVGHNAMDESRDEIRNPDSAFVASIAYFPERYGDSLMRLVSSILRREQVPPAVYTKHVVIHCENIDRYYSPTAAGGRLP